MKENYTGYNAALLETSRKLRREMTRQERHLWYDFLRYYPVKIYKQRSIDRFVVDFYCDAAKLAIELDGGQHYTKEGIEKDLERQGIIEGYGVSILRFCNADVDQNFEGVCQMIDREIRRRTETNR